MKNFIKSIKNILSVDEVDKNSDGTSKLDIPEWVGYTFGPLFILLGITLMFLLFKTKRRADDYKKRQLEVYNKDTGKNVTDYSKTTLFLPFWEKVKMVWPLFIGLALIVAGVAWLMHNGLTTKNF